MAIKLPEHEDVGAKNRALPWDMPKILIDGGSSVEILFYETFRKMGLKYEYLTPSTYNIFGFNVSTTRPKGEITLEIRAGKIVTPTTVCMVDVLLPYTTIMGRPWIHGIRGVASTYHRKLRFPTPDGVAEFTGDPGEAKYFYKVEVQYGKNKVNSARSRKRRAKNAKHQAEIDDYIAELMKSGSQATNL
ncbi:uncharacterized protein LOC113311435 [Papaver somniferum]|uniref:uncharacterized protein LOC113311435 n=1 Tax=Papaver somniferum TaxID=3469 RepID=UPI000E705ABC|nr:uncharacterized protein LOC113311435 [Papaver somniferum]